jgi:hypothetical protein
MISGRSRRPIEAHECQFWLTSLCGRMFAVRESCRISDFCESSKYRNDADTAL